MVDRETYEEQRERKDDLCVPKMKKLIMMRGLPGAGKSTTARQLAEMHKNEGYIVHLHSTDDFWGEPYTFVPAKIREAHLWNQNRALLAMIETTKRTDKTVIIIDNTNVSVWELSSYVKPAVVLGFEVQIVEPTTSWAFDVEECAKKTVHSVPVESIRAMLARWDHNLTVDQCFSSNGFSQERESKT